MDVDVCGVRDVCGVVSVATQYQSGTKEVVGPFCGGGMWATLVCVDPQHWHQQLLESDSFRLLESDSLNLIGTPSYDITA